MQLCRRTDHVETRSPPYVSHSVAAVARRAATIPGLSLELDHIVMAVPDLAAAARELEVRHGFSSVEGGRHPGWGTENRIVPLGEAYLELIAVADEAEARANAFGRLVMAGGDDRARLVAWAARTRELDEVAQRLGLATAAGSRRTADEQVLGWRYAGIEEALAEPSLPFFIEWAAGTPFPGRSAPVAGEVAELRLEGDPARVAAWLGPHALPITIDRGRPKVRAVVLRTGARQVVLSCDDS